MDDTHATYSLFITHIEGEGPFLKICGHVDQTSIRLIENLLQTRYGNVGSNHRNQTINTNELGGVVCVAKYQDKYYRARIMGLNDRNLVKVHLIDYGNLEVIPLSQIHFLDNQSDLLQFPVGAADYYLYGFRCFGDSWDVNNLQNLNRLLCNAQHYVNILKSKLPLISIKYGKTNFSQFLCKCNVGMPISVRDQENMLLELLHNKQDHLPLKHLMNIPPPFMNKDMRTASQPVKPLSLPIHIINNNITNRTPQPTHPVRRHKTPALNLPLLPTELVKYPPPTINNVKMTGSVPPMNHSNMPPHNIMDNNTKFSKNLAIFKTKRLDINSKYEVFVTYVEPGTVNFAVCLASETEQANDMMCEINRMPHPYLEEAPIIGQVCLGKYMNETVIARAVVSSVSNLGCRLYFVDFGDEQMVQYHGIFKVPDELLQIPAFAIKMCLSGVDNITHVNNFEKNFWSLVYNKRLTLKVVPPEGPPLLQYGELYYNGENILSLQSYKKLDMFSNWNINERVAVVVSYVDSCAKLFVQPASAIRALQDVMEAVKAHCALAECPHLVAAGGMCCALFPNDGNWYRARVLQRRRQKVLVSYVDYGNEQELEIDELRTITTQLLALPAVAVKCALEGFEDIKDDIETSNLIESMTLERLLIAYVVGMSNGMMLLRLVDENVTPPCNISKSITESMKQLDAKTVEESPSVTVIPKFQPSRSTIQRCNRDNENTFNNKEREIKERRWHDKSAKSDITHCRTEMKSQNNSKFNETRNKPDKSISNMATPRNVLVLEKIKELSKPIPLDTVYIEQNIEINSKHDVSVAWVITPSSFYVQLSLLHTQFSEMMGKIPDLYKGVKPYKGMINEGDSVLSKYPEDGVLYRATILSCRPFGKYVVQYIDFGNKFLVDAKDIWQLDEELMSVPKMAIHCSLLGVAAPEGEWKPDKEIDNCFNALRYQCVFQEADEEKYHVLMWNNGASVADTLVEKELAVMTQQVPSVTLKDEPIDLTIVLGQEIVCRVTHVESYEKFFIQLDVTKADLVESTLANYDKSLLCPLPASAVVEGQHCLLVRDGVVHRAILLSPEEATLPDLGSQLSVSPEELMTLPPELSVYYYQSLECRFINHTSDCREMMTLDELKQTLTGNKFILYVNELDDVKLVVTLYSVGGEKINVLEPDEEAFDSVSPMCHHAVFSSNFGNAYISHIDSLTCFYLHRASDSDRLAILLDEMFKFYEEGEPEALSTPETDNVCAAKSSDSNWYRARIMDVTDNVCKVKFADYGNTEEVPKDLIKKLDSKFYEPCAFALEVSLQLEAIQGDTISKLTEWTNDKETQVTLSISDDLWLANLNLDGVDLCMRLLNEKLAAPISAPIKIQINSPEAPALLPSGSVPVYISHIDSPGQFWIHKWEFKDKIYEMQSFLQTFGNEYAEIEKREVGILCIAKYSVDGHWYRAEIVDFDADFTVVRHIDFGNTEILNNQRDVLKSCPINISNIESFSIKCSLYISSTGSGEWSKEASDLFVGLLGDQSKPVNTLIILKDDITYVDIFIDNESITYKLIDRENASGRSVCACSHQCFVSHVDSPGEFWIQLKSVQSELLAMNDLLIDAEHFPDINDIVEGVICAAKFEDLWYRARILENLSEGARVIFIDYGNTAVTTELKLLPEELTLKPLLSNKCTLVKPSFIEEWSENSKLLFAELTASATTMFTFQFISIGDSYVVELYHEGESVKDLILTICDSKSEEKENIDSDGKDDLDRIESIDSITVNKNDTQKETQENLTETINLDLFDTGLQTSITRKCDNSHGLHANVIETPNKNGSKINKSIVTPETPRQEQSNNLNQENHHQDSTSTEKLGIEQNANEEESQTNEGVEVKQTSNKDDLKINESICTPEIQELDGNSNQENNQQDITSNEKMDAEQTHDEEDSQTNEEMEEVQIPSEDDSNTNEEQSYNKDESQINEVQIHSKDDSKINESVVTPEIDIQELSDNIKQGDNSKAGTSNKKIDEKPTVDEDYPEPNEEQASNEEYMKINESILILKTHTQELSDNSNQENKDDVKTPKGEADDEQMYKYDSEIVETFTPDINETVLNNERVDKNETTFTDDSVNAEDGTVTHDLNILICDTTESLDKLKTDIKKDLPKEDVCQSLLNLSISDTTSEMIQETMK